MPIDVVARVEYMAERLGHTSPLTFFDRKMNPIRDVDDELIIVTDTEDDEQEPIIIDTDDQINQYQHPAMN